ncbi:MAG: hypothetical protein CMJ78_12515 [Planctomycetaceae bacterium]|nr:hypothetical protein [Planctomycetaceae bacterium]
MLARFFLRSHLAIAVTALIFVTPYSSAPAQKLDIFKLGGSQPALNEAEVTAKVQEKTVNAGEKVTVAVTIVVPERSWTYSTDPAFGGRTRIRIEDNAGLATDYYEPTKSARQAERQKEETAKVVDPALVKADHPPKLVKDQFLGELQKYPDMVTWTFPLTIAKATPTGELKIKGILDYQICDDRSCRQIKTPFEVVAQVKANSTAAEPVAEVQPTFEFTKEVKKKPGPVTVLAKLAPADFQVGDTVELTVSLNIAEDWHVYSITQEPGNAATATSINLSTIKGLKPQDEGFTPSVAPEKKDVEGVNETYHQEIHHGEISWVAKFEATEPSVAIDGKITYQACKNDSFCLIPTTIKFPLSAGVAGTGSSPVGVEQPIANNDSPESSTSPGNIEEANASEDVTSQGLLPFLVLAFTSGFLALLTPCVFPMIPITVSFFLKQAESKTHRPVFTATVYCLGIICTFTVLGLLMAAVFGASSLTSLVNNLWLNLAIAAVLLFFGANLLGMFEIRVPSWLLTWSSGKESQGGIVGVLFMAFTFTLVSFTCTFAFAGLLLVMAANGDFFWPILGMLAFSTAFALPFFFLALFPSFLTKLPKSGGWMNNVKVTMGMVEIAAAFKFLSVADIALFRVAMLLDFASVIIAWIVIAACTGMYLLGIFRTPHDTPTDSISVTRLGFAMCFFGLAGYLTTGLFAPEKTTGAIWQNIAAFAPPIIKGGDDVDVGPVLEHEGLKYALDRNQAIQFAKQNNRPMLYDFTGVNCVNCRKMEQLIAHDDPIRDRLTDVVLVAIYVDIMPQIISGDSAYDLLEENQALQREWFGDITMPSYAIVTPDGETRLSEFKGYPQQRSDFVDFLDKGLNRWRELKSSPDAQLTSR